MDILGLLGVFLGREWLSGYPFVGLILGASFCSDIHGISVGLFGVGIYNSKYIILNFLSFPLS
jgi:hypothetical protein